MIGKITSTLSLTRLQKYSLFQKYRARSATWKLVRHDRVREVESVNIPGSVGWQLTLQVG